MKSFLAQAAVVVTLAACALLSFGLPWVYGGVEHDAQATASIVLAVGLIGVILHTLVARPTATIGAWLTLLPAAVLIALAGLQLSGGLVPATSDGILVAPQTVALGQTRLALAALIAVATAGLMGAFVGSREPAFHLLVGIGLVAATAVAFGGIALRLTGEDRMIDGVAVFGDPFARFINRNNGAAFLQLGVAAGLALLRSSWRPDPMSDDETLLSRGWRSVDRQTLQIVVGTLLGLVLAGVVVSKSRGGVLAAIGTIAVALPFFPIRRGAGRIVVLAVPLVLAGLLLAWLGLSAATVERFQSISIDEVMTTGRLPHWQDATGAMRASPWFGSGLGAYGYAYAQHSQIDYQNWYEHADNQFVELFVEGGAAGGLALLVVLILSGFAIARGRPMPVERMLIAGIVTGQALHAVFDYGIIVPAVALTAAVLWTAGTARLLTRRGDVAAGPGVWISRLAVVATATVLAGGLLWSYREHRSTYRVDRVTVAIDRNTLQRPGQLEPGELEQAISDLEAALAARPHDAYGHLCLGDYYVYRYRTETAAGLVEVDRTLTDAQAWELTGLESIHRMANTLARSGASGSLESLRRDPLVEQHLVPARRNYERAALACPRLSAVWIPLADLAFLAPEGDPRGTSEIEAILRLFPSDTRLLRSAGRLAWQAGEAPLARRCWQRAFTVNGENFWGFLQQLSTEIDLDTATALTCPEGHDAILQIATNSPLNFAVELGEPIGRRLEVAAEPLPDGPAKRWSAAVADRLAGRFDAASERLEALQADFPDAAALHAERARLQWEMGRRTEAIDEAILAAALDSRFEGLSRQMKTMQRMKSLRQEQPVPKPR